MKLFNFKKKTHGHKTTKSSPLTIFYLPKQIQQQNLLNGASYECFELNFGKIANYTF